MSQPDYPHYQLCIWCGTQHSKCEDPECLAVTDHHEEALYCSPKCEEEDLAQQRRDAYGDKGEAKMNHAAIEACRKLIDAYENSVDQVAWEDLNDAYQAACEALGHTPKQPCDHCGTPTSNRCTCGDRVCPDCSERHAPYHTAGEEKIL